MNTPGANSNGVAEEVIAMILAACRHVVAADISTRAGEWEKSKFMGRELTGKTLGIIGLGHIGQLVVKRLSGFEIKALGFDPYLPAEVAEKLGVKMTTVEEIFAEADFITLHIPENDKTRGMFNRRLFDMMKPGVYLINYARGPVINNEAVVEALKSGKVKAYATDFPTAEQLELPNVMATPHLGAGTPEADENCAKMAAKQIMDYLENGNIVNSVNLPAVSFPRAAGARITLINHNKPGMLGTITEKVAAAGLNIENLVNKSRDSVAYTILDFDEDVTDELVEQLKEIDGVLRVRVL